MNSSTRSTADEQTTLDEAMRECDPLDEIVDAMRDQPLTLLVGQNTSETSRIAREAAIALAGSRDRPAEGNCGPIVVVFDQWQQNPLTALAHAIAVAVDSATGILTTHPNPDPRSLAQIIAQWNHRVGASFIFVIDHFDRNLAAEPLNVRNARFTEQLADAINDAGASTNFLVVVAERDEALLVRLNARLGRPCNNVIRVADTAIGDPAVARAGLPPDSRMNTADEALPKGFSALGDEQVDASVREAVLRRREKRRRNTRWGMAAGGLAIAAVVVAATALFLRAKAPDPGALLARLPQIAEQPASAPPPKVDTATGAAAPASAPSTPSATQDGGTLAKATELVARPQGEAAKPSAETPADTQSPAPSKTETTPPQPVSATPVPTIEREPVRTASTTAVAAAAPPSAPPAARPSEAVAEAAATPTPAPAATPPADKPSSIPAPNAEPVADVKSQLHTTPAETAPQQPAKADTMPAAFKIDAQPGPPVPQTLVRGVPNPENGPMLFIHIRSEAQRAKARDLTRGLSRLSIVVTGTRVDERGPLRTDLRYFRSGERDEAVYLGKVLAKLGMPVASPTLVKGHESDAARRHYELWLAPPTR